MKSMFLVAVLLVAALDVCNAEEDVAVAAAAPVASAPAKHKLLKKLRAKHPAASAVNPEAAPDKVGGA